MVLYTMCLYTYHSKRGVITSPNLVTEASPFPAHSGENIPSRTADNITALQRWWENGSIGASRELLDTKRDQEKTHAHTSTGERW